MKTPIVALFLVTLSLALTSVAAAQGSQPGRPVEQMFSAGGGQINPGHPATSSEAPDFPFHPRKFGAGAAGAATSASPAVAVGEPGLSFRYVRTFGETEKPYLADAGHLNRPHSIFIDDANPSHLYVVEERGHRLLKYTLAGVNTLILGEAGLGWTHDQFLSSPWDSATDSNGHIWVTMSHAVKEFDAAGNVIRWFPDDAPWEEGDANNRFRNPKGIAFDSQGRLYVSDWDNHRIQVFDVSGGGFVHLRTIGQTGVAGSDNSHFSHPGQIAFDNSNRLYVADVDNHRIQRCTFAGSWTCTTFHGTGSPGGAAGQLNIPFGLGVSGNGAVFIADAGNGRIKKCQPNGSCVVFATGFRWPLDVAVDAGGRVYVSDWDDNTVRAYQPNGDAIGVLIGASGVPYVTDGAHYNAPWGVAAAPDGSLYITEHRGMRLLKLDAAGQVQWTVGEPGVWGDDAGHLGGLEGSPAVDRYGRIYVTDTGNNRVQVFNPDGSLHLSFGQGGTGNNEFACPHGAAISPTTGDISVLDMCNQRVQIFTSAWVYKATLGVTGETGSDNRHFEWPRGVAFDANGVLYVADSENERVQKCTLAANDYTCTTFVGETGVFGEDFGHLHPLAVAVDAEGRVYVVDDWNSRVQVFDRDGAYLTTLGNSWGPNSGQLRGPTGVAVDVLGNVYVAERDNHRVQKFAVGVPGWKQVNINGFGDRKNSYVLALAPFDDQLFAGTYNYGGQGAQVWRMANDGQWSAVTTAGFGDARNVGVDQLFRFGGQLYAGTWNEDGGGEVWRSSNGSDWNRVVAAGFGDPTNGEVFRFAEFNSQIYATTWSYTDAHGGEIWRSSTGNAGEWTRVVSNGFGDAHNSAVVGTAAFNNYFYAGTRNGFTGGEVWRSSDGADWSQVNTDGFGDPQNTAVSALAAFDGYLYAATEHASGSGAQVWRCQLCDGTDWQQVEGNGFGNPNTRGDRPGLEVYKERLHVVAGNSDTGAEVWRTANGIDWEQVGFAGFGDSNNRTTYWDNSVGVYNDRLFVATLNDANGGEIWQMTVTADFNASPTVGSPPLAVSFTNTSAGDFTSSLWDFGDGQTSTETNPSHTYTTAGTYTVTLTVSDGVDTHSTTRPAFVRALYRVFLPLGLRRYDPTLYDDFDDPTFDGAWNPALWHTWDTTGFNVRQENGAMVFSNPSPTDRTQVLDLHRRGENSLGQLRFFQAHLKISSDRSGGGGAVWIHFQTATAGYNDWYTECGLTGRPGDTAYADCQISQSQGDNYYNEYHTPSIPVNYDTWYTLRIETDPATANMRFFLDNTLLGSHTPKDAAALLSINTFSPRLAAVNFGENAQSTRYVDWVRITPAGP